MTARILASLVAGSILLSANLPAQSPGRALAIEDYYRMKTVGGPQISPDGKWVAFTVGTRVEETNGEVSEVWLADASGSRAPTRVSAAGQDARAVSWTESGQLQYTAGGNPVVVDPAAPSTPQTARVAGGGRGQRSPDGRWTATARN